MGNSPGRGEFISPVRRRGAAASPPGGGPAGSAGRSPLDDPGLPGTWGDGGVEPRQMVG